MTAFSRPEYLKRQILKKVYRAKLQARLGHVNAIASEVSSAANGQYTALILRVTKEAKIYQADALKRRLKLIGQ